MKMVEKLVQNNIFRIAWMIRAMVLEVAETLVK